MFLDLLQTVGTIEEAPAQEIETTSELTTELLRTLHIGNLLEELILRTKISKLEIGQTDTATHLINPVDSLLGRTVNLVLTLGSTKQHIAVTHHTEIDTAMQTCDHLVVETGTQVRILGDGQTTMVVVGNHRGIGSHRYGIADIAILKAVPLGFVGTDGPIKTGIERAIGRLLSLEELIEPGRGGEVCPSTEIARTVVTLDSMTLSGIRTGVHRCPLIVGSL